MLYDISDQKLHEMAQGVANVLIDGDMLLYRGCCANTIDIEWSEGNVSAFCEIPLVVNYVDDYCETIRERIASHFSYTGTYNIYLAFTGRDNFRKKLLSTYKANRAGKRKPVGYAQGLKALQGNYTCVMADELEADDVIGILGTSWEHTLIVSGDKDFKTIPGHFYDFYHDEFHKIEREEADRNLLTQVLTGDPTDGYGGCPGIGKRKAQKALGKNCTWETVEALFTLAGLSKMTALVQARMAYILRAESYDMAAHRVKLWTPANLLSY